MVDRSRLRRALESRWLEGLSYATIVAGIPLFFGQQVYEWHITKRERSLELVERFSQADLLIARDTVQSPWREISVRELIAEGIDRSTFNDLVSELVYEDDSLQRSVFQIIDFFESAKLCVDERLCNQEILKTFFEGYATEFNCTYGGYIDSLQETLGVNSLASGLRSFTDEDAECAAANSS